MNSDVTERAPSDCGRRRDARGLLPGVLLCTTAAAAALAVGRLVPTVSPLLVAILLGVVVAAARPLPTCTTPGIAFSGRSLLRAGIVLLGLQLSLRDIAALGLGTIALVIAVVTGGIAGSLWIGRLLGLPWTQRLLIACGFSICGAAAVAAVDGLVDAEEEDVATAVGLVVVFGTVMIGLLPLAVGLLDMDGTAGGLWAGASIHEVAQVVAAGGVIGGGALTAAIMVKLARVLMLAPVLAWVSWRRRRQLMRQQAQQGSTGSLPPMVPGFVAGFVALVLVQTWMTLPVPVLEAGKAAETVLLAAAMFALGCGVRIRRMHLIGVRPVLLATIATGWVAGIGLTGTLLLAG